METIFIPHIERLTAIRRSIDLPRIIIYRCVDDAWVGHGIGEFHPPFERLLNKGDTLGLLPSLAAVFRIKHLPTATTADTFPLLGIFLASRSGAETDVQYFIPIRVLRV